MDDELEIGDFTDEHWFSEAVELLEMSSVDCRSGVGGGGNSYEPPNLLSLEIIFESLDSNLSSSWPFDICENWEASDLTQVANAAS